MTRVKKDKKQGVKVKQREKLSIPLSDFYINLDLPGIYFVEAWSQYQNGCNCYKTLMQTVRKHDDFVKFCITCRKMSRKKAEKKFVDIVWGLREIEVLYEPVVKHFALGTILLAAAAEAYINEVAEVLLSERPSEEFNKLALLGKWTFLPKICGIKVKWNLGAEPLQGLSELVSMRNKLMHFKGRRQKLGTCLTPKFLHEMNLMPNAIGRSFKSVQTAIKQFSLAWTGSFGPNWLSINSKAIRRPCFYLNDRRAACYLHSGRIDKNEP